MIDLTSDGLGYLDYISVHGLGQQSTKSYQIQFNSIENITFDSVLRAMIHMEYHIFHKKYESMESIPIYFCVLLASIQPWHINKNYLCLQSNISIQPQHIS